VTNQWIGSRNLYHSYLANQRGFLVFCCDGRGMSGRGRSFKHLAYGDISKWMVHDQLEAVKHVSTLSFVDPARIGFWGWSGGGYMACMLATRASSSFAAVCSSFYLRFCFLALFCVMQTTIIS
jgi:dipeptidyl-peptidase-4